MAKAVLCPVCGGTGKLYPPYPQAAGVNEVICHGCEGKG